MLPDLSSAKWSIDDKNKTITIDDIIFPVRTNDYIGKSEPKYVKPKENLLLNMLNYLYWILLVITFFIEKDVVGFFEASILLIFFVYYNNLFATDKNIFVKIIFFLLTLFMVILNIGMMYDESRRLTRHYTEFVFASILIVSMFILNLVIIYANRKIEKNHKKREKEYYESDAYRKEYYDTRIKPYLLYEYLKKKMPIYSEIKEKHQLIESDNFKSDNIDVLMSKIYVKAFLLDATAIVMNQNNISNEVSGYIHGYVRNYGNTISGRTSGETTTKTTHFANVSFVKNKEK